MQRARDEEQRVVTAEVKDEDRKNCKNGLERRSEPCLRDPEDTPPPPQEAGCPAAQDLTKHLLGEVLLGQL